MRLARTALATGFLGLASLGCGGDGSGGGATSGGATSGGGDGDGGDGGSSPGGCTSGTDGCVGTGECGRDEPVRTGEATYYNEANGTGNCSFDASPDDLMIGAMNLTDYAGSAACGACVELSGPSGKITIRIVDRCPECAPGDIDLSPDAFSKVADLSAGRVPISWTYVGCPVDGPLRYHWKEGSNPWWTAVQIRNHRHAVQSVEYKTDDGTFKSIARLDYNYFVEDAGMGPGPYTLRVTDVYGQVVEDTGIPFAVAADAPGASQLPACAAR